LHDIWHGNMLFHAGPSSRQQLWMDHWMATSSHRSSSSSQALASDYRHCLLYLGARQRLAFRRWRDGALGLHQVVCCARQRSRNVSRRNLGRIIMSEESGGLGKWAREGSESSSEARCEKSH
jgi:hypothetical protein